MSTSENDLNDSNTKDLSSKALLTQEFNTINTSSSNINNTISTHITNNTLNTHTSGFSSLPFFISQGQDFTCNVPSMMMMGITPPSFVYHPFPLPNTLQSDQLQQQFKRVKIDTSIADELNSFKVSLKSSFEANLQKLAVLDRLVQTVSCKGNFQFDALKSCLQILTASRSLLKDLIDGQVQSTALLTCELKKSLIPEITEAIRTVPVSKGELVDKLRKEEDSHLTDLMILSTRNKELQRDQRSLKEQFDRLQTEYTESLKTAYLEKEEFRSFTDQLARLLSQGDYTDTLLLDKVEELLGDNEAKSRAFVELLAVKETLESVKNEINCLITTDPDDTCITDIESLLKMQSDKLMAAFEDILHSRERFYNQTLNSFTRRLEDLIASQSQLAHQALSVKMSLQGQLADSHENCGRLRQHCQQLTADLNSAALELDNKRISLQTSATELVEMRKKFEDRIRQLEAELSGKNQEARSLAIRNQELQAELDENERKHRHDLTALERKISILESKVSTVNIQNNAHNNEITDDITVDPFSSLGGRRDSIPSTIPPTCNRTVKQQDFVVTFTGIRDAQKQKEYGGWLGELGATVHTGPDFNDEITHVLAPRGYKSIRVLAASLTGKWIVNSEWLEACHVAREFVPESAYKGYCNTTIRPFRFRTLWMSAAFSSAHKSHPTYPTGALRTLLEKLGKARWCDLPGQADFLIVTEEEKTGNRVETTKGVLLTLSTLLSMIPTE